MVVKIFNNIEIIMRFYFLLWSIGYGVSWIVVKLMLLLCILYSVRGWYCGFSLHYVIFVRLAMWIFLYTPNEVFFLNTTKHCNYFFLKLFSVENIFRQKTFYVETNFTFYKDWAASATPFFSCYFPWWVSIIFPLFLSHSPKL